MLITKEVYLNKSQSEAVKINANMTFCLMPRGEGKTSLLAMRLDRLNTVMPRSQILLATDTMERLETTIVPNLTAFLTSEMNLVEDEDFCVFKKPPEHWIKPFIIPRKFDRVISFKDGLAVCCGGLFKDGGFNGFNGQAALIDELKYVNPTRLKSQLFKALRGHFKRYGHLPEYRSVWGFSDKYQGDLRWVLAMRDKQDKQLISAVRTVQEEIFILEQEREDAIVKGLTSTEYKLTRRLVDLNNKVVAVQKELVYVCDPPPFANIEILGEKYYRDARRDCVSLYEYETAILNKDPDKVENSFYADLTEDNYYECERLADVDPTKELIVSFDVNWRIVPMEVLQISKLPGRYAESLNTVASFHALHKREPMDENSEFETYGSFREVCALFNNYFSDHMIEKRLYFVYDATLMGNDPARNSYSEIIRTNLLSLGWIVNDVYIGGAPDQSIRNEKFKDLFQGNSSLAIMLNKNTTTYLQKSINQAGAVTSYSGNRSVTKKDKKTERDLNFPARESTHHSEAWDHPLWAVCIMGLISSEEDVSIGIHLR